MLFSLLPKHPCLTLVTLYSMMQSSRSFVTLNLDGNGQLYLLNTNGLIIKTILIRRNIYGKALHRATMDADGIFWLYSHNLDQYSNWSIQRQIPADNNCASISLCGSNSYCTLVDGSTVCACPPGFEFIDKIQKNLGCQQSFSSDICQGRNFIIQELKNNVEWKSKRKFYFSYFAWNGHGMLNKSMFFFLFRLLGYSKAFSTDEL